MNPRKVKNDTDKRLFGAFLQSGMGIAGTLAFKLLTTHPKMKELLFLLLFL